MSVLVDSRPVPSTLRKPTSARADLRVTGARGHVPLVTGGSVAYANLDYAASAPVLTAVRDAVVDFTPSYASVHRGAGLRSQHSTRAYEKSRTVVRDFVGGRPQASVIFTRNTTDSLNLLAHCLPAATTVVVFETEHHAALLPWRGHRVVRLPAPATPADAVASVRAACSGTGGSSAARGHRRLERDGGDLADR